MIPMAALVAVMIMVSVGTFDWHSDPPATLRRMPSQRDRRHARRPSSSPCATHNLASASCVGVLVAMVLFARRVAHFDRGHRACSTPTGTTSLPVDGELFFASSNDLVYQFDYADDPDTSSSTCPQPHIWDASTVAALDAITTKYSSRGKTATITGMNEPSRLRHAALAGNLTPAH